MTAELVDGVDDRPIPPEAEPEWRLYELEDLRNKLRAELHDVSRAITNIYTHRRDRERSRQRRQRARAPRPPQLDQKAQGCKSCGGRPTPVLREGEWRVIIDHRRNCVVLRNLP